MLRSNLGCSDMVSGKTEPMENLHQSLCTFKCRKVITHECPCINVLSIETSSHLNVETKPRTKWCGSGETEPMENLHLGNGILALVIMKNSKTGHHFINMLHMEKFSNYQPPKVWVSCFPSVNGNGILASAIMKKFKNGCHFINTCHTEKFQITDPQKFGSLVF